jgi:hypothetical protein
MAFMSPVLELMADAAASPARRRRRSLTCQQAENSNFHDHSSIGELSTSAQQRNIKI